MHRSIALSFPLVALLVAGCSDASNSPVEPAAPAANVSLGHAAFVATTSTDNFKLRASS